MPESEKQRIARLVEGTFYAAEKLAAMGVPIDAESLEEFRKDFYSGRIPVKLVGAPNLGRSGDRVTEGVHIQSPKGEEIVISANKGDGVVIHEFWHAIRSRQEKRSPNIFNLHSLEQANPAARHADEVATNWLTEHSMLLLGYPPDEVERFRSAVADRPDELEGVMDEWLEKNRKRTLGEQRAIDEAVVRLRKAHEDLAARNALLQHAAPVLKALREHYHQGASPYFLADRGRIVDAVMTGQLKMPQGATLRDRFILMHRLNKAALSDAPVGVRTEGLRDLFHANPFGRFHPDEIKGTVKILSATPGAERLADALNEIAARKARTKKMKKAVEAYKKERVKEVLKQGVTHLQELFWEARYKHGGRPVKLGDLGEKVFYREPDKLLPMLERMRKKP
jgi:hypothetical protein